MDLHLAGKLALVTASTGGIGREIATSLAREGATVIVNGRTEESVAAAIEHIQSDVVDANLRPLVADNGTAEGAGMTVNAFPSVDILVNNLGVYEAAAFADETDEDWARMFEINLMSVVRLSRHYLPVMLGLDHGRILMLASEAALMPAPEMAHYSASKAAILSLSRSLAEMTKGSRVTVNSIVAGSTKTEGVIDFISSIYPDQTFDEAEAIFMGPGGGRFTSLIQRLILPEEIADLVAFVASPLASAINGSALRCDGGLVRSMV
ncbi:SDR family oxidoreductase [Aeromicrobium sp.]|uniref:SDR family NAD(P)-dependent oxidoreductase n=1 Tax=Aeromicrobium sp. TaxID=1871063 RepID=UPI0030C2DFBA